MKQSKTPKTPRIAKVWWHDACYSSSHMINKRDLALWEPGIINVECGFVVGDHKDFLVLAVESSVDGQTFRGIVDIPKSLIIKKELYG